MALYLAILAKVFFILSPFYSISAFLMFTAEMDPRQRKRCAFRTGLAILTITLVIFYFGKVIFSTLGITVPAFQIGAGSLLYIHALFMVLGKRGEFRAEPGEDFAIVPLATPLIVGPGTVGTLMVFAAGIDSVSGQIIGGAAVMTAALAIWTFLFLAVPMGRILREKGLFALMKLTGLVLSAIAAQLIFTGIRVILHGR